MSEAFNDLRQQLPPEFRDADEGEIQRLWIAAYKARRGKGARYIAAKTGLSIAAAERMVELCAKPSNRHAAL